MYGFKNEKGWRIKTSKDHLNHSMPCEYADGDKKKIIEKSKNLWCFEGFTDLLVDYTIATNSNA